MAHLDFQRSRVRFKIVYYGPGLCGKTTNLQRLHEATRGACELVTLSAEGEKTLFFDYMPIGFGKVGEIDTVFKVYTVPGQVRSNSTRQTVLEDVDGVVFVADSRRSALESDVESLANLAENLAEQGVELAALPLVIQYNKCDLDDACPIEELERALNPRRVQSFVAAAITGRGVEETFAAIAGEVYRFGVEHYGLAPSAEFQGLIENAERPRFRSSVPPLGVDAVDDWRSIASSRPPFSPAQEATSSAVTCGPPKKQLTAKDAAAASPSEFERKMLSQLGEIRHILEQLALATVDREDLGEIEIAVSDARRHFNEQIERNTQRLGELAAGAANFEKTILDLRDVIVRDVRQEIRAFLSEFVEHCPAKPAPKGGDVDRFLADYLGYGEDGEPGVETASRSQLSLELCEEDEPEPEVPPQRETTKRYPLKETQPPPGRRSAEGRYRGPGQEP